jgi:hypothetical protein
LDPITKCILLEITNLDTPPPQMCGLSPESTEVAAGNGWSVVITSPGKVYVFGYGGNGQLGTGGTNNVLSPLLLNFPWSGCPVKVSCGMYVTQVLTSNGTLYHFGSGSNGMLGFGDDVDQVTPKLLVSNVYMISGSNRGQSSFFGLCPLGFIRNADGSGCDPACYGIVINDTRVCNGNGICIASDTCSCKSGWTDQSCNVATCYGIPATSPATVCNGKGTCIAPDTCTCKSGWTGNSCNACRTGYNGTDCQIPVCFGVTATDPKNCNSHGNCTSPNNCTCIGF